MVGSDDGQIRMYSDKSLTRANTAIPGLGAAITAVDVTYDGKWVLATTNNYLMVVKTTYKVGRQIKPSTDLGMVSLEQWLGNDSCTDRSQLQQAGLMHWLPARAGQDQQGDERLQEQDGRARRCAAPAAAEA